MTPEEEIKQFGIQQGADMVGIASVADINRYAPPGHRPDDILIGAKSVIVVAGRRTLRGGWRSPDYRTQYHNRDFAGIRLGVVLAVAKFIESRYGYYALADTPPAIGFNPSLSFKLCAEMAGIGTRSLAGGVILNRELGLTNFYACVTTMRLIADGPLEEPVCPDPSCVKLWERRQTTPCLEVCPECLSGELEGGRIKWMRYDRRICSTRAHTPSLKRLLLEGIKEPDLKVRRSMLLGSLSHDAMQATASGAVFAQCSECLRNCPICRRARSLKVKILDPEPL